MKISEGQIIRDLNEYIESHSPEKSSTSDNRSYHSQRLISGAVNFLFHPPKTAFHLQWKVGGVVL